MIFGMAKHVMLIGHKKRKHEKRSDREGASLRQSLTFGTRSEY
jgi:hypothetical protein